MPRDGSAAPALLNAGAPGSSELLFIDLLSASGGQVVFISNQDPLAGTSLAGARMALAEGRVVFLAGFEHALLTPPALRR